MISKYSCLLIPKYSIIKYYFAPTIKYSTFPLNRKKKKNSLNHIQNSASDHFTSSSLSSLHIAFITSLRVCFRSFPFSSLHFESEESMFVRSLSFVFCVPSFTSIRNIFKGDFWRFCRSLKGDSTFSVVRTHITTIISSMFSVVHRFLKKGFKLLKFLWVLQISLKENTVSSFRLVPSNLP